MVAEMIDDKRALKSAYSLRDEWVALTNFIPPLITSSQSLVAESHFSLKSLRPHGIMLFFDTRVRLPYEGTLSRLLCVG